MIQWWVAVLVAVGFTFWSLFCVLIGASLSMTADKKLKAAARQGTPNPRLN